VRTTLSAGLFATAVPGRFVGFADQPDPSQECCHPCGANNAELRGDPSVKSLAPPGGQVPKPGIRSPSNDRHPDGVGGCSDETAFPFSPDFPMQYGVRSPRGKPCLIGLAYQLFRLILTAADGVRYPSQSTGCWGRHA
jgi:hypothetical protein